jgi:hypothetical protein
LGEASRAIASHLWYFIIKTKKPRFCSNSWQKEAKMLFKIFSLTWDKAKTLSHSQIPLTNSTYSRIPLTNSRYSRTHATHEPHWRYQPTQPTIYIYMYIYIHTYMYIICLSLSIYSVFIVCFQLAVPWCHNIYVDWSPASNVFLGQKNPKMIALISYYHKISQTELFGFIFHIIVNNRFLNRFVCC